MFFITTNKEKAGLVKEDYKQIYKTVNVYEYFGISVITTSNSDRKILMKSFGENAILIAGTIFDQDSFNEALINSYKDFNIFVKDLKSNEQIFFGHYVVIVLDAVRKSIEVITDRIGLINVYYSMNVEGGGVISDDLLEIGKISNSKLYDQAVYEFLLTGSNVGKKSIFEDVFRLGFGKQLLLQNGVINEKNIYDYRIEKLSKEEYVKRIENYFKCFNNYTGKISTDLSAGYDTRLINAIAYKTIEHFEGFNNINDHDGGCDGEISKVMTDRLGIKLNCIDLNAGRKCRRDDYLTVLRETAALRDAKQSQRMTILLENKYKVCDLAIGGYGGEVIRAKYNKYAEMKEFVDNFYYGDEGVKICKFTDYSNKVMSELGEYRIPCEVNSELLQNWYYAVSRMRIWGSGFIHLSLLYGDVVHPFMDWYLLNPVFGFKKEELYDAKLQMELINTFAPQLSDLPINARMNAPVKNLAVKGSIKNILQSNSTVRCISCEYRNIKKRYRNIKESFTLTDNMTEELLNNSNMDIKRISTKCGKTVAQRMQTIISACRYGEFPSERDM